MFSPLDNLKHHFLVVKSLVFRGAHGLVLSARSSFFAAALGLLSFVERGRRSVHLGIVEARKLPGDEEDHCHKV